METSLERKDLHVNRMISEYRLMSFFFSLERLNEVDLFCFLSVKIARVGCVDG